MSSKSSWSLLKIVLGPAALLGLLMGVVEGWSDLSAGFPLLFVAAIQDAVALALAATVVFTILFTLIRSFLARQAPWLATAIAVAVAGAPFVAFAGYRLNRSLAVRPSEILELWALLPNLALLAGCGLALLIVGVLFHRLVRREGSAPAWPGEAAFALFIVLYAITWFGFRSGEKNRTDVIVILVDALRADHLGAYGHDRDTSPAIDALAKDGVVFRQAISPSTFTKTSIASLLTGKNPYRHGIYWGNRRLEDDTITADVLADEEKTLAEHLRDAGYLTAAWVQNSHLRAVMGFDQGFVEYHDQQGSIERIHRRVFPWLEGPGRRYGFFTYLHYIDLHDPYLPEPPYDTFFGAPGDVYAGIDLAEWGAYLEAVREGEVEVSEADVESFRLLYDGQLRAIDDEISRLFDHLKSLGLYEEALIVLTSDHGDAFMEHGFISHSFTPYDELVRVPLVVKLPGNRHAGEVIDDQVRLVDVLPTILGLVGEKPRRLDVDGCDLTSWITAGGRPADAPPRCEVAVVEIAEGDGEPTLALRSDRFKYIRRGGDEERGEELYDLLSDPGELENLADALPEDAVPEDAVALKELASALLTQRAAARDRLELDEKTIRELKALGYIGE